MSKFVVGKKYESADGRFDPIKIVRRTDKVIWVDDGGYTRKMLVRKDMDGNEYVRESSLPKRYIEIGVYNSKWESN